MRLECQVDIDDLVEFNVYHHDHSTHSRRMLNRVRIGTVMFFALVAIGMGSFLTSVIPAITFFGLMLFWAVFMIPWSHRRSLRKNAAGLFRHGHNMGALGHHTWQITPEALLGMTPTGRSIIPWNGVENIATTPDHTFVYCSEVQAAIIPRRKVTTGDYEAFVNEVRRCSERPSH